MSSEGNLAVMGAAQWTARDCHRHAGIPEVVLDGETGVLVAEGDVEAMADAMLTLLEKPMLAQQFGQAGQRRAREHFTVEHHLRDVTGLLLRVVRAPEQQR